MENDLHNLIKSLTPSEKRYFKRFIARNAAHGQNAYLRVFEAVDAQPIYDQEAIRQKFLGASFMKQFPVTKSHLKQLILRSLRSYHNEGNITTRLHARIEEIEILYERKLLDQSDRLLNRTLKLAKKHEQWLSVQVLYTWKRKLVKRMGGKAMETSLNEVSHEETKNLRALEIETRLQGLGDDMFELFRRNIRQRDKATVDLAAQLVETVEELDQPGNLSFRAKQKANILYSRFAHMGGKTKAVYVYYKENIKAWNADSGMRKVFPGEYASALAMLLSACHTAGAYQEYEGILSELRNLSNLAPEVQGRIFSVAYSSELLFYLNSGNFPGALEAVGRLEDDLQIIRAMDNSQHWLPLCYNAAVASFMMEDFSRTLKWINRILNFPKSIDREDLRDVAEVLNLIVHYELGNFELVAMNIRSVSRRLKPRSNAQGYEQTLIKHLKLMVSMPLAEGTSKVFASLKEALSIQMKGGGPFPFGLKEILAWTRARHHGKLISDAIEWEANEEEEKESTK